MPFLRSVSLRSPLGNADATFPFSVPVVRQLEPLELSSTVTFLVGENGSGKSTLLEGIALAARLPTVGSEESVGDATLKAQRDLAKALLLTWNRRVTRGFFLRAEDFFGFTKTLSRMRSEFIAELGRIDEEYKDRSAY